MIRKIVTNPAQRQKLIDAYVAIVNESGALLPAKGQHQPNSHAKKFAPIDDNPGTGWTLNVYPEDTINGQACVEVSPAMEALIDAAKATPPNERTSLQRDLAQMTVTELMIAIEVEPLPRKLP